MRDSWAQRTRSESTERRRDPFIKRKRGEPQEQVTETQSEGKTRFYPTHSHEFRGQTGKGNPIGEGMAPGNKNWLRMPNRPTERGKSTSASEIGESERLQCKNFHAQRQRALNKMPQIRKDEWQIRRRKVRNETYWCLQTDENSTCSGYEEIRAVDRALHSEMSLDYKQEKSYRYN